VKSVVQAAQEEKVGGLQFEVILGKSLKKKKKARCGGAVCCPTCSGGRG
jgi:hypothetical protein